MTGQDETWPTLRDPEQTRVLHAFLRKFRGVPGNWIEKHVPGVSANDLSRWRRGEGEWLSGDKFQALKEANRRDDLFPPPDLGPPDEGDPSGRQSA